MSSVVAGARAAFLWKQMSYVPLRLENPAILLDSTPGTANKTPGAGAVSCVCTNLDSCCCIVHRISADP
jgi:hypothetical protein